MLMQMYLYNYTGTCPIQLYSYMYINGTMLHSLCFCLGENLCHNNNRVAEFLEK